MNPPIDENYLNINGIVNSQSSSATGVPASGSLTDLVNPFAGPKARL